MSFQEFDFSFDNEKASHWNEKINWNIQYNDNEGVKPIFFNSQIL
jgi:hypothetical protein